MKQITIIRHARTEFFSSSGLDFDRRLTTDGIKTATENAWNLAAVLPDPPDLILASSAARTVRTAEIFAEILKYPQEDIITDLHLYHAGGRELLMELQNMAPGFKNILLIGHNPAISELAAMIAPENRMIFSPADWISLHLDTDDWHDLGTVPPALTGKVSAG